MGAIPRSPDFVCGASNPMKFTWNRSDSRSSSVSLSPFPSLTTAQQGEGIITLLYYTHFMAKVMKIPSAPLSSLVRSNALIKRLDKFSFTVYFFFEVSVMQYKSDFCLSQTQNERFRWKFRTLHQSDNCLVV